MKTAKYLLIPSLIFFVLLLPVYSQDNPVDNKFRNHPEWIDDPCQRCVISNCDFLGI